MIPCKSRRRPKNNEQLNASCRCLRPVNGHLFPLADAERSRLKKKSGTAGTCFLSATKNKKPQTTKFARRKCAQRQMRPPRERRDGKQPPTIDELR
jgi:hypothetical protein